MPQTGSFAKIVRGPFSSRQTYMFYYIGIITLHIYCRSKYVIEAALRLFDNPAVYDVWYDEIQ